MKFEKIRDVKEKIRKFSDRENFHFLQFYFVPLRTFFFGFILNIVCGQRGISDLVVIFSGKNKNHQR